MSRRIQELQDAVNYLKSQGQESIATELQDMLDNGDAASVADYFKKVQQQKQREAMGF